MVDYIKFWMAYELARFFWFLIIIAAFAVLIFGGIMLGRWSDHRRYKKMRDGK